MNIVDRIVGYPEALRVRAELFGLYDQKRRLGDDFVLHLDLRSEAWQKNQNELADCFDVQIKLLQLELKQVYADISDRCARVEMLIGKKHYFKFITPVYDHKDQD